MDKEKARQLVSELIQEQILTREGIVKRYLEELGEIEDSAELLALWKKTSSLKAKAIELRMAELIEAIDPKNPPDWFFGWLQERPEHIFDRLYEKFLTKAKQIQEALSA